MRFIEDNIATVMVVFTVVTVLFVGARFERWVNPQATASTERAVKCEGFLESQNKVIIKTRTENANRMKTIKMMQGKIDTLLWFGARAIKADSLARVQLEKWQFEPMKSAIKKRVK